MMGTKLFEFEVWHPDYGTAIVESIGEDSATNAAAKVWGAPWREIAGYCRVRKLRTARKPRCRSCHREFGEAGDPRAYCPECLERAERYRREAGRFAATVRAREKRLREMGE